jgi:ribonuclease HI
MSIIIYTDGAAKGNPGPGGYGAVLMTKDGKHYKELSDGFAHTTNNRMELLSVIIALETLKGEGQEAVVYSDSKYVVEAVEKKWVFGWAKKGFKNKKNPDLWRRFLQIYPKHKVKLVWVKGHAGNRYNERCDQLAVAAAEGKNLKKDVGYEESSADNNIFTED